MATELDDIDAFELVDGDGRVIAGGSNGPIEVRALASGERRAQYRGHSDGMCCIAPSPAVTLAASTSTNGSATLGDLETGEPIAALVAHRNAVRSVAFSPDGRSIVTGSEDGAARLFECVVCADDAALMRVAQARLREAPP